MGRQTQTQIQTRRRNWGIFIGVLIVGMSIWTIVRIPDLKANGFSGLWTNASQTVEDDENETTVVTYIYWGFNCTDRMNGEVPEDIAVYTYIIEDAYLDYTAAERSEFTDTDYILDDTDSDYTSGEHILKSTYTNDMVMFYIEPTGYWGQWVTDYNVEDLDFDGGIEVLTFVNKTTTANITLYSNLGNSTFNQTTETENWVVNIKAYTNYTDDEVILGVPGLNYDFAYDCWNTTGLIFKTNSSSPKSYWIDVEGALDKNVIGDSIYVSLGDDWTSDGWTSYTFDISTYLGTDFEVVSIQPYVGNVKDGTTTTLATAYTG